MAFCNDQSGCNERVCIRAKKVYDACKKQVSQTQLLVNITNVTPPNPTSPLKFVSGKSTSTKGIVENLVVERLIDRPQYGRVQCDVIIPFEVIYLDANNVEGTGIGTVTVPVDVVMYLPEASIMPYQIEASVSAVSPDGVYSQTVIIDEVVYYCFVISCCSTVIVMVTIDVELIVPTYGYAVIPPCQDYSDEVCTGFFDLPLYPNQQ
ncbi:MAG: hypothetical protein RR086_01285 [Clostridia bacterium]